jgi:glycosyltransferase involved in cell wall biosynthesis
MRLFYQRKGILYTMILYLVIPCYNEEEVLPITSEVILVKMNDLIKAGKISPQSRILLVDDGSKDKTWEIITDLAKQSPIFAGLKLSKNKGHQNALLCGLMEARKHCDVSISLDADLQDDINAIDECIEKFKDGCDVVYCVRNSRKTDTIFKRSTALAFYKLMSGLGVDSVYNHADYRLMSRRALDALADYKEVNLFLRGIVPLIGYRHDYVYYSRSERAAGESKYPLKKMLNFAIDGITSFSVKPLRTVTKLGFFVVFLSFLGIIYSLISLLFLEATVPGWTSILISIWLIGGIQLLCIGICGEYIGKIYSEVKNRPRYNVEELILQKQDKEDKPDE